MLYSYNEFHISKKIRQECKFDDFLYASSGNVVLANIPAVRNFQYKFNSYLKKHGQTQVGAGELNALGLLDEIFHIACYTYRRQKFPDCFKNLLQEMNVSFGEKETANLLTEFCAKIETKLLFIGDKCQLQPVNDNSSYQRLSCSQEPPLCKQH